MFLSDFIYLVEKGEIEESPFADKILELSGNCLNKTASDLSRNISELSDHVGDTFEREVLNALIMNLEID